jgi:hypothetical protein
MFVWKVVSSVRITGAGNRREVNDGVSARKALDRLPEVGQVGEQRRRR